MSVVFIPEEVLVVKTTKSVIAKRCVWLFSACASCFVDFTFKERSSDEADTTIAQRLIQGCKWDVMVVGPLIGLWVSLCAVVVAGLIYIADV